MLVMAASEARGPRAQSAQELKDQIVAERDGRPFLVYRNAGDEQQIVRIEEGTVELWIGRSPSADIQLEGDNEVSGLHAQIEFVREDATLVDDGLSTNGSYVNGERIRGRRRLRDGDMIRAGQTVILYRAPGDAVSDTTAVSAESLTAAGVSPGQRRVLVALCRPFKDGPAFATPATNAQIAEELTLSVDAIKTHMRALFEKFGVEDLPQNQKRVALVERALQSGLITDKDL
jgi:hypothetical protein